MKKILSAVTATALMLSSFGFTANAERSELWGDVNGDGSVNIADAVSLQQWLINPEKSEDITMSGDMDYDETLSSLDLCLLRNFLLTPKKNTVRVTDTEELKNALSTVSAGDEIVVASGEYVYSGSTAKGYMFKGETDGTAENPIVIRCENPEEPPVLSGTDTNSNCVFAVFGDYWIIDGLKFTNAQKGVLINNSNHTKIVNCEIYNTGSEGLHFRDDSSYNLAENCYIHDTGVVSKGYGEAIYVGSAKSTTGYGFKCDYNTIRNCRLGPDVSAEHVDVKEYTTGTVIENCTFDGTGMSGENSAKAFVNIKGNDCILRNNTGYRNGCDNITRAFEQNNVVDGWGQNALVYGNTVYMDKALNDNGKKMYLLNAWNCSSTVWDNFMAYDGELFSVDDESDHWNYYNCNMLTYGGSSFLSY